MPGASPPLVAIAMILLIGLADDSSGAGEQMVETDLEEQGGVPELFRVKAGDLIHIPASVFHQTINDGSEVMELLAVYSPTGPEAVIRALPDHVEVPRGPWPAGG